MKKVYEIKVEHCDMEGRNFWYKVERRVYTTAENAEALVAERKAEIKAIGAWWCGYGKNAEGEPNVKAEALEIEGL